MAPDDYATLIRIRGTHEFYSHQFMYITASNTRTLSHRRNIDEYNIYFTQLPLRRRSTAVSAVSARYSWPGALRYLFICYISRCRLSMLRTYLYKAVIRCRQLIYFMISRFIIRYQYEAGNISELNLSFFLMITLSAVGASCLDKKAADVICHLFNFDTLSFVDDKIVALIYEQSFS